MKILLVDDHVVVREGVRRLLATAIDASISEAGSSRDALQLFRDVHPNVVVLDLSLPGISGLELIRRFLSEDPAAQILVLSMHSEPIYAARALQSGARGYISKAAPADELITAIQRVADGGRYVEHEIAIELAVGGLARDERLQQLTNREVEILRLLGEGNSLRDIADALGVAYKTIVNSCTQMKDKLMLARTADLIRFAVEMRRS
ncbi:MAG TPA: response regulator transcription factor [Xanthobacteraceae bacterium]|jgi:DNA-binding NarL/FixJ family response regulator|nr:response regulator transcription factor [Xanthobacteraceae bacterium]